MYFPDMVECVPAWLSNSGPHTDIVVSTRVRLARNLRNYQFPSRASFVERKKIFEEITAAVKKIAQCKSYVYLNFSNTKKIDQQFLLENRLVSPDLIDIDGDRGVIFNEDNRISIMINEEDHIRMQCIDSGFQPEEIWKTINELDDEVGKKVGYAFDVRKGFLTCCPTNSGTGFRVSFLIHLPGLVLSKTIESVLSGASQMGIAIRGFFGEHSEVIGNLFQLSNQATMGAREDEFLKNTKDIIDKIVNYERAARKRILDDAREELEEKIYRAYGILRYAQSLSVDELLNLTSALRMGIDCGIFNAMDNATLNKMVLMGMPAHLECYHQCRSDQMLDETKLNKFRAQIVRKFLPDIE